MLIGTETEPQELRPQMEAEEIIQAHTVQRVATPKGAAARTISTNVPS